MSSHGFVYLLMNPYMPDVVKIGCTERSPHLRADELSKPTGAPAPFEVVCYIEVADFQYVERKFHEWFKAWRITPNREFFAGISPIEIAGYFKHFYDALAFTDVSVEEFILPKNLWEIEDPWEAPEPEKAAPGLTLVVPDSATGEAA
jgi:hypothetical protein